MCGILGWVRGAGDGPSPAAIETALATLGSRGPDGSHLLDLGQCVLGHARLAVIDLVTGDQPMRSADGRLALVFNGEIYNYQELRAELEAQGASFRTRSDSEVLLVGYQRWGASLLARLDGMFAFAIWDSSRRSLFAARDRLGIKPFFYADAPGGKRGFAFGSTLAPFFALPGVPRRLDLGALRDYLAFQAPLAPASFLADVAQLPPAHWLRYDADSGALALERWWALPRAQPQAPRDREALVEAVDRALAASVKRQLVSDVPLGAFLSGGIDSSLMLRYMAEAGARPLKTFTLKFADEAFDETDHARAAARAFGAAHEVLEAPSIDGAGFAGAIAALDQPLADPAYVMTRALARLTREHVTVAISGDGGDELFGGYARYWDTDYLAAPSRAQRLLATLLARGLAPGAALRRALHGRELLLYKRAEVGPFPAGRKSLAAYLAPEAYARCAPGRTLGRWFDLIDELGGEPDPGTLMRTDLWTYLCEDGLVKTDRASMAHGLEVRVPMLGNEVLDTVLPLPASVHAPGGGKALLREIARRSLPETVWNRPKHGFSVPVAALFNGAWREVCEAAVADCARRAPFLDAGAVQRLWRAARRGEASRRLAYTFVVLLVWLESHPLDAVAPARD